MGNRRDGKPKKKLPLRRATVRDLSTTELGKVGGAVGTGDDDSLGTISGIFPTRQHNQALLRHG
jgi:hypothetical protein